MDAESIASVLEKVTNLKDAISILERATTLSHIQKAIASIPKDVKKDIEAQYDIRNLTAEKLLDALKKALAEEKRTAEKWRQ